LESTNALGRGIVQVWTVHLDAPAGRTPFLPDLPNDERLRAERLLDPARRRRFIASRAWARRIIAYYMDVPPAELVFGLGDNGKPQVHPAGSSAGLEFSLSHSGDLALLAIARGSRVGVDVEQRHRPAAYLAIARRFFAREEYLALKDIPDAGVLAERFLVCWTRKEAYLKATGFGLTRGMSHFEVTVASELPPRLVTDRLDPTAADRWAFLDLKVPSSYCAALVAEAPLEHLQLHDAGELTLV
jgi:4'-phosphopantetheinyl transferase